jgi:hypothetical protein
MFKCAVTGKTVLPGVKQVRQIVEQREKQYTERDEKGKIRIVGQGWEIVEEIAVCPIHGGLPGAQDSQKCGAVLPEPQKFQKSKAANEDVAAVDAA